MSDKKGSIQIRTSQKQEQIVEQLSRTPIVEIVCQKVGIGRNSYYRWRRQNKKFASACDKAIEEGCSFINDLAESQLISAMKNNNLTAIMYWLNHRHSIYSPKLEVTNKSEIKKDELTKDQERNILRALKLASLVINNKGDNHEQTK
jgi:transposase-like protein